MDKTKTSKGFTLIEILFVIIIIGILASMVVISLAQSSKDKARVAKGLSFADSVRAQLSTYEVAWWKFDESSGNSTKDSWGSNNGTLVNGPTSVDGVSGKALSFDGTQYVDINYSNFNVSKITVEAWVKFTTTNRYIVTRWIIGGWIFYMRTWNNSLDFAVRFGADFKSITSGADKYNDGKWHHVVGVMDGSNVLLYVDTKKYTGPAISGIDTGTSNVRIGRTIIDSFIGQVDEVRIYSEALTAQQIQRRYAESAPRHGIALK